ncbi:Hypothetical_protein [Hexamita inflata]|uniref:Hypothetical_protein n=1 Tax=Hexamita inflata TaxID=28002 RepID=A0AA86QV08_9EUKA|nr:Hypothetical protein HINF_LOCUS47529 [Hexamita inflata]
MEPLRGLSRILLDTNLHSHSQIFLQLKTYHLILNVLEQRKLQNSEQRQPSLYTNKVVSVELLRGLIRLERVDFDTNLIQNFSDTQSCWFRYSFILSWQRFNMKN